MSELPVLSRGAKTFSQWQPIYAERGISLIPCSDDKVPLVKNPQKFGRDASAMILSRYQDATTFGYYCGRRNGITVLDVDTPDERVLADAITRHGQTPLLFVLARGNFMRSTGTTMSAAVSELGMVFRSICLVLGSR